MAKHTLFEDAAAVLSGSKANAPADPPKKIDAEIQDLGGPTPQNSRPEDDSNKLNINAPDYSKQNQASVAAKTGVKKEDIDFASDINSIFNDTTLSEDFKSKATVVFEARVYDRVAQIKEELETEYSAMFEESVNTIKEDLANKVNDYLDYVIEQWVSDNEIAIESGLRSEIAEDFITGLKDLFVEHYIDVPETKVDLVGELAAKVEQLEEKLNDEITYGIGLKKSLLEAKKIEAVHSICEGLTATQVEKMKMLAESIDYSTEEDYLEKLGTIRENYFPSGVRRVAETQLNEHYQDTTDEKKLIVDPFVNAVSQAISKTKK